MDVYERVWQRMELTREMYDEIYGVAYVHNALFHLNLLRSTVHDGLTNGSDLYLKVSLLEDLDAAEHNLRTALR